MSGTQWGLVPEPVTCGLVKDFTREKIGEQRRSVLSHLPWATAAAGYWVRGHLCPVTAETRAGSLGTAGSWAGSCQAWAPVSSVSASISNSHFRREHSPGACAGPAGRSLPALCVWSAVLFQGCLAEFGLKVGTCFLYVRVRDVSLSGSHGSRTISRVAGGVCSFILLGGCQAPPACDLVSVISCERPRALPFRHGLSAQMPRLSDLRLPPALLALSSGQHCALCWLLGNSFCLSSRSLFLSLAASRLVPNKPTEC